MALAPGVGSIAALAGVRVRKPATVASSRWIPPIWFCFLRQSSCTLPEVSTPAASNLFKGIVHENLRRKPVIQYR